jgi:methylenetetrahydrofolate dehydrogenase (NADP+)/methenyltetrahydrofolate cyclohydrolase
MAVLIDGKATSQAIKDELKAKVEEIRKTKGESAVPTLAVVLVGDDPASAVYVRNKKKACEYIGIGSRSIELPAETCEEELLALIDDLNGDAAVTGILVQLPLPAHIDENKVIERISPEKDVDGFNPVNAGRLFTGRPGFVSCTPAGIVELLKRHDINIAGKHCVVVGRSNIVGKPMALLMLKENATVTVCHSKTVNLQEITKQADILICAIGKPRFFGAEYVKDGAVVVDVGIHRMEDGKLCGDVRFDEVEPKCSAITPVPGGVGPMTIAMLMYNCVQAAGMQ